MVLTFSFSAKSEKVRAIPFYDSVRTLPFVSLSLLLILW